MNQSSPLTVGVVAEHAVGERRVALVPDAVQRLTAHGLRIIVEPGAGAPALIPDALYVAAGAMISVDAWHSDVVLKVSPPSAVMFGTINVIGGFVVTDRTLAMFKGGRTEAPR